MGTSSALWTRKKIIKAEQGSDVHIFLRGWSVIREPENKRQEKESDREAEVRRWELGVKERELGDGMK